MGSDRPAAAGDPVAAGGLPAGRVVGRRRALPSGRAVAGGFLIAAAAVAVFSAALSGSGSHRHDYLVAARDMPAGSTISPADLRAAPMELPPGAAADAFADARALVGRSTAVDVAAGEVLERTMLASTGAQPALRPVSVPVDATSLSPLHRGSKVDVLEATGTDSSARVSVVLRGAVLVGVAPAGSSALGPAGTGRQPVTLGVASLGEVEAVVRAASTGTVSLVAAEPSDGSGLGPGPAGG